jgi:hypothetical protein
MGTAPLVDIISALSKHHRLALIKPEDVMAWIICTLSRTKKLEAHFSLG